MLIGFREGEGERERAEEGGSLAASHTLLDQGLNLQSRRVPCLGIKLPPVGVWRTWSFIISSGNTS